MAKFTLNFRLVETIMMVIMTFAVIGVSTQTFENFAFPFDDGWDYQPMQSHVTNEDSRFYFDTLSDDCCHTLESILTPQVCHEIVDMPVMDHQVETMATPIYETTRYGFGTYDLPLIIYRTFDATKSANETVSAGNETIPTTTLSPSVLTPETQNITQINNLLSGFRMYMFDALDPCIYRKY